MTVCSPQSLRTDESVPGELKRTCRRGWFDDFTLQDLSWWESKLSLRKEVIQPQVPLRLPCYDLVPVIGLTVGSASLTVSIATSGTPNFRDLTGGVYKAQEHIHRGMLIRDY